MNGTMPHGCRNFPISRHIEDVIDDGYDVSLPQYLYGGWYVFKSHPVALTGEQVFMLIIVTAVGRAISGCVRAVAYADIYGAPTLV